MKLVMTMMVRDEADIIAAMIEHHLAQGIDLIMVTDNASIDGTREILAQYAERGFIELSDDPRHEKQQAAVVTAMARRAFTEHGADWVINADADEFYFPLDRSRTLRDVMAEIPTSLRSFTANVVNLTGTPARHGSGVRRLTWRDHRAEETLMDVAGLHAHPTPNAIHVGSPDVDIQLGNHFINIESQGQPSAELAIEVLHLPWRSLDHYRAKVEMSGKAFEANPMLRPSPNHHGQRDYRRFLAGYVQEFYLYRHPVDPANDLAFTEDRVLLDELESLAAGGGVIPDLLGPILDESGDGPFSADEIKASGVVARTIIPLERVQVAVAEKARDDYRKAVAARKRVQKQLNAERKKRAADVKKLKKQVAELKASRSYRLGNALLRPVARMRRR
ncbi:MAG TPA: glycosyltransferase family 2 protein [Aeromicrobium sp.]|nr:glycosyltransferase family 2 protein [Aeromicrobium sp.]